VPTPAVFLDRDDTLIACNDLPPPPPPGARGDLVDPSLVRLLPGVREGCHRLRAAGFTLVVVSNQGSVARGIATPRMVERVNDAVRGALGMSDLPFYYCPFHPKGLVPLFTGEHPWRKPHAGMIHAAASELALDLARSWLIGDASRDVEAGVEAGLAAARCLRTGQDHLSFDAACERILYDSPA
jgi:D-glycero-D-manno-heptose 1,7-bisphosphate phosphatase